MLTLFTQPSILKQIGPVRLALFFTGFTEELEASNIVLPTMDYEKDNDFPGLAAALVPFERLPDRLRKALLTLEEAASPENHNRLHETTNRRLPCISLGGLCDLDHALELWFAAPDELAQFQNGKDAVPEIPKHRNTETLFPSNRPASSVVPFDEGGSDP